MESLLTANGKILDDLRNKLNLKVKALENFKIQEGLNGERIFTTKRENVHSSLEIRNQTVTENQNLAYLSNVKVKKEIHQDIFRNVQQSFSKNVDDSVNEFGISTSSKKVSANIHNESNHNNRVKYVKKEKILNQDSKKYMSNVKATKNENQTLVQNNCRIGTKLAAPLKLLNLEYGNINSILSFDIKNDLVQTVLKNLKFNDFRSFFKIFAWINQNPISPFEYNSKLHFEKLKDLSINNHHSTFQKDQINKSLFEIIYQLLNKLFEQFENEGNLSVIEKNKFQFDFTNNSNYKGKIDVLELLHDEFFMSTINLIKFKEFNLYSQKFKHSLNDSYFKFEKELHVFKKFITAYYCYSGKSNKNISKFPNQTLLSIVKSKFELLEFEILKYFKYLRFDEKKRSYLIKNSKKCFVRNYNKRKNLLSSAEYVSRLQKSKNSKVKSLEKFLSSNPLLANKMITKISLKNIKFLIDCDFQTLRFLINDIIIAKNILENQNCFQQELQHLESCRNNIQAYLILLNDPRLLINFNLIKWNQLRTT